MTDAQPLKLSDADREALDALVDAGLRLEGVAASHRDRAARLLMVMGVLDHLPTTDPGDIAERTIARVAEARRSAAAASGREVVGRIGPGMRWTDVAAIAAMVLIAVGLAFPVLSHNRAQADKAACAAHMQQAGLGFSRYADAHGGALPHTSSRPGDPWWNTNQFDENGNTQSNSAHLFVLVRNGYVDPADLQCAGRKITFRISPAQATHMRDWPNADATSFSYPNMFVQEKPRWQDSRVRIVLADENPLFTSGQYRNGIPFDAPSPNHAVLGGQNALLNDGSVDWLRAPVVEADDNIWRIEGLEEYHGNEVPEDPSDAFLVP
mgnify:FL=1